MAAGKKNSKKKRNPFKDDVNYMAMALMARKHVSFGLPGDLVPMTGDEELEIVEINNRDDVLGRCALMKTELEKERRTKKATNTLLSIDKSGEKQTWKAESDAQGRLLFTGLCVLIALAAIILTVIFSGGGLNFRSSENDDIDQPVNPPTLSPTTSPTPVPTPGFSDMEWSLIGSLPGREDSDEAGFAVSVSDDGTIVAVGARKDSTDGEIQRGSVRIYALLIVNENKIWNIVNTFVGNEAKDQFGFSVSVSGNGKRVAVGSINEETTGSVQVFERTTLGYFTKQNTFFGENGEDRFGSSVSLSYNGKILAVGAPLHGTNQNGKVYLYEDTGTDEDSMWRPKGEPIAGIKDLDLFGVGLSLASDGSKVAIGAPLGKGRENESGYARVFEFDVMSNNWKPLGNVMIGMKPGDRFGNSLSLSSDGNLLVVGAYESTNNNNVAVGQAAVFKNTGGFYIMMGEPFFGSESGDRFGYAVSIAGDGKFLAVGAPRYNSRSGAVQIYQSQTSESWIASNDILSEDGNPGDLGFSVSLSSDASVVAIGLPLLNEARVYEPLTQ